MTKFLQPDLPVLNYKEKILQLTNENDFCILSAPPGTGKSTLVPQFFLDDARYKRICVLEPRKLAARHLASFVAQQCGTIIGDTVGYQVRFESRISEKTRIIYQTYGVFVRQLLQDPFSSSYDLVILDEFHERSLEVDLVLAWINTMRKENKRVPKCIVMSATIDTDRMSAYLNNAPLITIESPLYPVSIRNQDPLGLETVDKQAFRALQSIYLNGLDGSVLMFMPGLEEIRAVLRTIDQWCVDRHIPVFALYGALDLNEQIDIVDNAWVKPSVIVATNVAETSLTIPGIRFVIDSGYVRAAAYDPVRDRNTLYKTVISTFNAVQRTGRAGRLGPGQCVRLYSKQQEQSMLLSMKPEIECLELSSFVLTLSGVLDSANIKTDNEYFLDWLTKPEPKLWDHALELVRSTGGISVKENSVSLTPVGREMLKYPLHPSVSRILVEPQSKESFWLTSAIMCILESNRNDSSGNVLEAALQLLMNPADRYIDSDIRKAFSQINSLHKEKMSFSSYKPDESTIEDVLSKLLFFMKDRIASLELDGARYFFTDGRSGTMDKKGTPGEMPQVIIGCTIQDIAGSSQGKRCAIRQWIPVPLSILKRTFEDLIVKKSVCEWNSERMRVVAREEYSLNNLVIDRKDAEFVSKSEAEEILVKLIQSGTICVLDETVEQYVYRCRLVAQNIPDYGFPLFTEDDWILTYHELCSGAISEAEVRARSLLHYVKEYVGSSLCRELERLAPVKAILPSGKSGKITYFESSPPELSARIGDLLGVKKSFTICDNRVQCVFNILAPNYRTVQKTTTIDLFWTQNYPSLKKELQRKYPRHPWP